MKLVNERKNARSQQGDDSGSAAKPRKTSTTVNKYGDAMSEMMNRIKQGNVVLKKANRRFSEVTDSKDLQRNAEKIRLKNTGKYATIDSRSKSSSDNPEDDDIFDQFRAGLKPMKTNLKSSTLDPRNMRSSDTGFNFRNVLKTTPNKQTETKEGSAVEEMKKLTVRRQKILA